MASCTSASMMLRNSLPRMTKEGSSASCHEGRAHDWEAGREPRAGWGERDEVRATREGTASFRDGGKREQRDGGGGWAGGGVQVKQEQRWEVIVVGGAGARAHSLTRRSERRRVEDGKGDGGEHAEEEQGRVIDPHEAELGARRDGQHAHAEQREDLWQPLCPERAVEIGHGRLERRMQHPQE